MPFFGSAFGFSDLGSTVLPIFTAIYVTYLSLRSGFRLKFEVGHIIVEYGLLTVLYSLDSYRLCLVRYATDDESVRV